MVVGLVLLIGASCACAQDWPQWRGPNRDGQALGFPVPAPWPAALTQGWRWTVGAGDACPVLVGDKLYTFTRQGDNEVVSCLGVADGKLLWKNENPTAAPTGPSASVHPGPRSTPAVADGKVVTLGVMGTVSCLDAATGTLIWRKDPFPGVVPRFYTAMSPLIVNQMALVHVGGPGNGALIAYDLATGAEKWRWAGEGPGYDSPVLMTVDGTPVLVELTEKSLVGVAVGDGKLLWQVPFEPQGMAYNAATPIVDGQTVIITGAGRGTKAYKIAQQGGAFTATELWTNADVACQFCSPVLANGMIFGVSSKGNVFCLKEADGTAAWVDQTPHGRGFGAMLAAGGVVLALPENGPLLVLQADDKQLTVVAQYKVSDLGTYALPILAGKRIFVKDQQTLTLWTIG
jgi:outer membrane protein assembly factor BamB